MKMIRPLRFALLATVPLLVSACALNQLAEKPLGSADRPIRMATVPFLETGRLTLGMKNIFDRDPPYTNQSGQFAGGYDVSYADVRGRFLYGQVQYRFR